MSEPQNFSMCTGCRSTIVKEPGCFIETEGGPFCSIECRKKFLEDKAKVEYLMKNGTSFFTPQALGLLRQSIECLSSPHFILGEEAPGFRITLQNCDFERAWRDFLLGLYDDEIRKHLVGDIKHRGHWKIG